VGGRDRIGKLLVGVAVEVRGAGSGRVRLQVLPNSRGATPQEFLQSKVAPGAVVHTDGWNGYSQLRAAGYDHRPMNQHFRIEDRTVILLRAHRAISNLKTWLAGTHRATSAKHLQVYLDESPSGTTAAARRWRPSRPASA
jgi:transposase-like protein